MDVKTEALAIMCSSNDELNTLGPETRKQQLEIANNSVEFKLQKKRSSHKTDSSSYKT